MTYLNSTETSEIALAHDDSKDKITFQNLDLPAVYSDTMKGYAEHICSKVKKIVDDRRISKQVLCNENWELYQGNHAQYFQQRRLEPNETFKWRKDNAVIVNYIKFVIETSARMIYGRSNKVRRNYTIDNKRNKTEERMRELDSLTGVQNFMKEAKVFAGIFGEAIVQYVPIDKYTRDFVTRTNANTIPQPVHLDPRSTWVLTNEWDKIVAVVIEGQNYDFKDDKKTDKVVELFLPSSRWKFTSNSYSVEENTLNLMDEFVVLKNTDQRRDEISSIKTLQIELDEAMTDSRHFFERHAWPQMVSSIELGDVIHNPNYVWEISSSGSGMKIQDEITFLTWDGKVEDARKHIQDLENSILTLSYTAQISTGKAEALGQLRSGAAMVSAHGPSIQKAQDLQITWAENEKRFLSAMARIDAVLHKEAFDTRFPEFSIKVTFPADFVPGEELVRAEIDSMSLNSHTIAITDIIRKNNPEFNEEEVEAKRNEILDDSRELTDSKREFVTEQKESGQPIKSPQSKSQEQKSSKKT